MNSHQSNSLSIQKRIVSGMAAAVGAARATYGPAGWTVAVHRSNGQMRSTKCGATVLETFSLQDPFEDAGAHLLSRISMQIRKHAGDGSTLGVLLAQSLAAEAFDGRLTSSELAELSAIVRKDAERVENFLRGRAIEATSQVIKAIAFGAAGNDIKLSETVCDAFAATDDPQAVFLVAGERAPSAVYRIDGLLLDCIPIEMPTNPRVGRDIKKANLVLWTGQLSQWSQIAHVLNTGAGPYVVLAEKILPTFRRALDRQGEQRNVFCFEMSGSTQSTAREQLEAIARTFNQPLASADSSPPVLKAPRARIVATGQRILLSAGSITISDDPVLTPLKRRASVIRICEMLDAVTQERCERAAQSIAAVQSACKEGVVAGGGASLLDAARWLGMQEADSSVAQRGREILCRAMAAPMRALIDSAGLMGDLETRKLLAANGNGIGFDVFTRGFVPAVEAGIVTPLRSIVTALRVASSTVGLVLLTEALAEGEHARNARLTVFSIPDDLH